MEGLPFLPGNTFRDPTKSKFHRSHTLGYSNGYSVQKTPMAGIGGEPHPTTQLAEKEPEQQQMKPVTAIPPTLMYGDTKVFQPSTAVPAYIAFDKKVLKFNAYFSQTVDESALESVRTRPVYIYYYLEDDSISVVEPQVPNSGIPQGKLMKRQRLPRGDGGGDHWHWKHLNLGISVQFYGIVFRIVDCDTWTKEFMENEGIELNSAEEMPPVPHRGTS
ncbi:PREDICTED: EF-hand domain-containing protein 1-like [Priapulus caudatus]|uniref:EF-hand domain-containing protein 1-like n=1 Tax=Priapulus caudatus TaxID=37621 RepID=A0ABM1EZX2_PRICU|nr:PREDICTED: EF-hand domain-containing protein 1-like [Priapulus caudatus]